MPDVIVKGMKMPEHCGECLLYDCDFCVCTAKEFKDVVGREPRPDWCPLRECETTDRITLYAAMNDPPVWMMVYAANPLNPINVKMTYADLFMIHKLYEKERGDENGNSVCE